MLQNLALLLVPGRRRNHLAGVAPPSARLFQLTLAVHHLQLLGIVELGEVYHVAPSDKPKRVLLCLMVPLLSLVFHWHSLHLLVRLTEHQGLSVL